jgi:hypothetical protein
VNAPPAFAQWYEPWAYRGDVVTVTGTTRKLHWTNGWSYWQLPWRDWVHRSASSRSFPTG